MLETVSNVWEFFLGKGLAPAQNAGLQKRFSRDSYWLHADWARPLRQSREARD